MPIPSFFEKVMENNIHPAAYWGPAFESKEGQLSDRSKRELRHYRAAGFRSYTLTGRNPVSSPWPGEEEIGFLDLFPLLDFAQSIGLGVIVRDETLQRLSHVRLPLLAQGNPKLILGQLASGEWVFPTDDAHFEKNVLTYRELDGTTQNVTLVRCLKQWPSLAALQNQLRIWLGRYASHPAFRGIDLWDEPGAESFRASFDLMEAIRSLSPSLKTPVYFQQCLLPAYGFADPQAFLSYLDTYAAMAKKCAVLDQLESDVYPLCEGKLLFPEGAYEGQYLQKDYVFSLVNQARIAEKYGLDFVVCLQSFGNPGVFRDVSEAGLYWQARFALALGAKAFDFYPYTHDTHATFYSSSIVEGDYRKGYRDSSIYPIIQKMNGDLQGIFGFFKNYHLARVAFYPVKGHSDFESCQLFHSYFVPVQNDRLPLTLQRHSGGLLVSELKEGERSIFCFVSTEDPDNGKTNEVSFSWPEVNRLRFLEGNALGAGLEPKGGLFHLILGKGASVFLVVEREAERCLR